MILHVGVFCLILPCNRQQQGEFYVMYRTLLLNYCENNYYPECSMVIQLIKLFVLQIVF